MLKQFDKPYNSKEIEKKIYRLWEKSGFFNPDKLPARHKKPFTIIMPPPNANGSLHIGHAVFVTLQDIMIRYHRMKGDKTLWLPGADHAGFETQVVYDKKLEKEGRSRFKIPRDKLWKEMWDFTQKNKEIMENQLRQLGASCDWSREKFTLDKDIIDIVYKTFEKLKKDNLLYRGKRIVNWCIKHQTSLSDVELKYEERKNCFYYVKYKVPELNSSITVATTRPETIPADVALAVNPKDKRYKKFIGRHAVNPLNGERLLIITDSAVDIKFGTGVLKITPDHDRLDEEIYNRHSEINKDSHRIINPFGKLEGKNIPKELLGLKVKEARDVSIKILENSNNLDEKFALSGIDSNYLNTVALCYKCGSQVEPLSLDNQWFVKMTEKPKSGNKSLRDIAVEAVKSGKVEFIPKRFEKVFFHWMKNIRDWNISRQIVWGIKIPDKSTEDVFDTWFSSGQWPFATLMTSGKNDFKNFYPTDVMETAWDILFFWVARMIMFGLYITGKPPFKYVYLHGLVRDKERQKMSKSKGNVIDPLGVIDIYGADALRMALIVGNTPGNDPIIYEEKIRGYRNFANKIWQASRFVLMNCGDLNLKTKPKLTASDRKKIKELEKFKKEITKFIGSFKFHTAAERLYHYFWHTFADKIIESTKPRLKGDNKKDRQSAQYLLLEILKTNLKLLHPFMPFITEEIWQYLPIKEKKLLMVEKW
ncbi:MAG: class I tRNA ligase family protein [Candidatus Paceibacterota bacterium]